MLSRITYFLYALYCIRSFIAVLPFIIGVILILIWKTGKKGKVWLTSSIILTACAVLVFADGCYNVYLRPTNPEVNLTEQELIDFGAYLTEDTLFLNTKEFLPNNNKDFYREEKDDVIKDYDIPEPGKYIKYSVDSVEQRVCYAPSADIYYYLTEFEDAETAKKYFETHFSLDGQPPTATKNKMYIETEKYTVYAAKEFSATFFDLHQGDHNSTRLNIFVLYENYVIHICEDTEWHTMKLYSLIKKERLFDNSYELTTWVHI